MIHDVHLEWLMPILDFVNSYEAANASVGVRHSPIMNINVAWAEITIYLKRLRLPPHGR